MSLSGSTLTQSGVTKEPQPDGTGSGSRAETSPPDQSGPVRCQACWTRPWPGRVAGVGQWACPSTSQGFSRGQRRKTDERGCFSDPLRSLFLSGLLFLETESQMSESELWTQLFVGEELWPRRALLLPTASRDRAGPCCTSPAGVCSGGRPESVHRQKNKTNSKDSWL